jgi:hypothetical protein
MKLVCAWCNTHIGEKYSEVHPEDAITHGICDKCMESMFVKKQIDFIPFLNTISAPVILIDKDNRYVAANESALKLLGNENKIPSYHGPGDVFKCENAHLEGHCGHTERCGGCQILNLINETYTGKHSFAHVPVQIIQKENDIHQKFDLVLTTEKINDFVMMRIDSIG